MNSVKEAREHLAEVKTEGQRNEVHGDVAKASLVIQGTTGDKPSK